jgi:hypothetical protein
VPVRQFATDGKAFAHGPKRALKIGCVLQA